MFSIINNNLVDNYEEFYQLDEKYITNLPYIQSICSVNFNCSICMNFILKPIECSTCNNFLCDKCFSKLDYSKKCPLCKKSNSLTKINKSHTYFKIIEHAIIECPKCEFHSKFENYEDHIKNCKGLNPDNSEYNQIYEKILNQENENFKLKEKLESNRYMKNKEITELNEKLSILDEIKVQVDTSLIYENNLKIEKYEDQINKIDSKIQLYFQKEHNSIEENYKLRKLNKNLLNEKNKHSKEYNYLLEELKEKNKLKVNLSSTYETLLKNYNDLRNYHEISKVKDIIESNIDTKYLTIKNEKSELEKKYLEEKAYKKYLYVFIVAYLIIIILLIKKT